MAERSSIFDMIGPVMIGPSSSHTAGVVRIGRVGYKVLGSIPKKAEITFYNSFARTYEGHGSDRAVLAGLMDMKTDDPRIKTALEIANQNQIEFSFKPIGNASLFHPNTVRIKAYSQENETEILGVSKGGGVIRIVEVNGFSCNFSASGHTLIIEAQDRKGAIAFITAVLAQQDCNIAEMSVARRGKNQTACQFYEMDSGITPITLDFLKQIEWISKVIYIPSIDI
jgi:L-serine dehydratase